MQNEKKDSPDIGLIEICIHRSKEILKMKQVLVNLRALKQTISTCSMRFPSEDKLTELESEIKMLKNEYEIDIAKLLKPSLRLHGIELSDKFWFSSNEIKHGYVLLRKPTALGATHVLFLGDMEDTFDGSYIKSGDIKLYKHVNHFLEMIDVKFGNKLKKNDKIKEGFNNN